jgi:hypothetical protein
VAGGGTCRWERSLARSWTGHAGCRPLLPRWRVAAIGVRDGAWGTWRGARLSESFFKRRGREWLMSLCDVLFPPLRGRETILPLFFRANCYGGTGSCHWRSDTSGFRCCHFLVYCAGIGVQVGPDDESRGAKSQSARPVGVHRGYDGLAFLCMPLEYCNLVKKTVALKIKEYADICTVSYWVINYSNTALFALRRINFVVR